MLSKLRSVSAWWADIINDLLESLYKYLYNINYYIFFFLFLLIYWLSMSTWVTVGFQWCIIVGVMALNYRRLLKLLSFYKFSLILSICSAKSQCVGMIRSDKWSNVRVISLYSISNNWISSWSFYFLVFFYLSTYNKGY